MEFRECKKLTTLANDPFRLHNCHAVRLVSLPNREGQMSDEKTTQDAIRGLSPEQKIGLDVPRQWASGAQVSVTPDVTFIVFRDQTQLEVVDEEKDTSETHVLVKNVTTMVIPTPVARQLSDILQAQLLALDATTAAGNAEA